MTLTLTYHRGAGVNKQRGQVLTTVTVGETRGSDISGERHRAGQLDYGDVIVQTVGVPSRMLYGPAINQKINAKKILIHLIIIAA